MGSDWNNKWGEEGGEGGWGGLREAAHLLPLAPVLTWPSLQSYTDCRSSCQACAAWGGALGPYRRAA